MLRAATRLPTSPATYAPGARPRKRGGALTPPEGLLILDGEALQLDGQDLVLNGAD